MVSSIAASSLRILVCANDLIVGRFLDIQNRPGDSKRSKGTASPQVCVHLKTVLFDTLIIRSTDHSHSYLRELA